MTLRNGAVSIEPSYEEILMASLKRTLLSGDDIGTYSLVYFFTWNKADTHWCFDASGLNEYMDLLNDHLPLPDLVDCESYFGQLERIRKDETDLILAGIDKELASITSECRRWIDDRCPEELEKYRGSIFEPLELYIKLISIAREGLASYQTGQWKLPLKHKRFLQSIKHKNELDFNKIEVG